MGEARKRGTFEERKTAATNHFHEFLNTEHFKQKDAMHEKMRARRRAVILYANYTKEDNQ